MEIIQIKDLNQSEFERIIMRCMATALRNQPKQESLPQPSDYITRRQAAELLQCSLVSLHAWAKQGKVKLYHFAGKTFLKKSEVLAAMKPVSYSLNEKTR